MEALQEAEDDNNNSDDDTEAAAIALARGLWARVAASAATTDFLPPTPGELGASLAVAARMGLLGGGPNGRLLSEREQEHVGALVASALPRWDAWSSSASSSTAAAASEAAAYAGLLHGLATAMAPCSLASDAAKEVAARLRRALIALAPRPDPLDPHTAARALVALATLGLSLESESGLQEEDSALLLLLFDRATTTTAASERAAVLCAALALGVPAASAYPILPSLRNDLASGCLPEPLVAQLLQGLAGAAAEAAATAVDAARGLLERHRQRAAEGDEDAMAALAPSLALALDGALRLLPSASLDALLPRAALAAALHRACACAVRKPGGPRLSACALTVAVALAPPAPPSGWAADVLAVVVAEEEEEEEDAEEKARARAAAEALDAWAAAAI
jgi:hypothetical protein